MAYIYRVENEKGKGCYRQLSYSMDKALEKILGENFWYTNSIKPAPEQDQKIARTPFPHEVCGFKDVRQALRWFKAREIRKLRLLGFELKKIKVQQITAIGETQVLAVK